MCSHLIGIRTNHLIKWRGNSMYGLNNTCFQCRAIFQIWSKSISYIVCYQYFERLNGYFTQKVYQVKLHTHPVKGNRRLENQEIRNRLSFRSMCTFIRMFTTKRLGLTKYTMKLEIKETADKEVARISKRYSVFFFGFFLPLPLSASSLCSIHFHSFDPFA